MAIFFVDFFIEFQIKFFFLVARLLVAGTLKKLNSIVAKCMKICKDNKLAMKIEPKTNPVGVGFRYIVKALLNQLTGRVIFAEIFKQ